MPIVSLPGMSTLVYPFDVRVKQPTVIQQLVLDSSTTKVAFGGRVWFPERGGVVIPEEFPNPAIHTRDIVRVWILLGTVIKSGGSSLLISLQSVEGSPSADQPHPSGTVAESVVVTNGDVGFVTGNCLRSGVLSAARTVSYGELISVVVEFNSFLGSDSVGIGVKEADLYTFMRTPWATRFASGVWNPSSHWPIVVFEFSDGTYGTLDGVYVTAGPGSHSFLESNDPDEYGLQFTVPYSCSVDALYVLGNRASSGSVFKVILYSGTNELASVTLGGGPTGFLGYDSEMLIDSIVTPFEPSVLLATLGSEVTLGGGSDVIIAVQPTAGSSQFILHYEKLGSAGHQMLWGEGGATMGQVSRTDQGSWSAVDGTKVPLVGMRCSAFQDTEA